ncbi:MAG: glycosyltransferase family 2 protein [Pseudomonadota bacterium]
MRVSVVIVNFNAGPRLQWCLDHLAMQTLQPLEIIVVDNGSSDDSLAAATDRNDELARRIKTMPMGRNLGFAQANNLAASEATGEWLAFLNPDAYAAPDWLARLAAAVDRHPQVEAFGSLQIDATNTDVLDGCGDVCTVYGVAYRGGHGARRTRAPSIDKETFAPCAAAALYSRERFLELGGFDERFFCYGEDVDLGFRHRNAGGRCVQVSDAIVRHEGSGITGKRSSFAVYHGHRNRVWFYYKNVSGLLYWSTAPARLLGDVLLLCRAATDGVFWPYLKGIRDGYRDLGRFRVDRQNIAKRRRESQTDVARALTWSPVKLLTRAPDLRPLVDE